jgi:linoleoyl-CoA desaturase
MAKVTFNNKKSPFFDELRARTDKYFKDKKINPTGNYKLYAKTVVLVSVALIIYSLLVFGNLPVWASLLLCAALGCSFASIGFNVMHDGAHGSYSKNKHVNNIMSYSLNLMGGSSYMWKVKHNVVHHTYTNIQGVDDDIAVGPLLRINEQQPRYWIHKFQHVYWVFLYGVTYFMWIFWMDFLKYFTNKVGSVPIRKMKLSEHIGFWLTKVIYLGIFLILPAYTQGLVATLVGYGVVIFVCGVVIASIFQLAHVVEGTAFPEPDPTSNKIEDEWAKHQVLTTANFATRNKLISWLCGGLNFQVEHHLFPKISHIHYPALSKIVRETCEDYNINYIEYPTLWSALGAHVRHLKTLGQA